MSVTEVKANIMRRVEQIDDPTALEDINTLIEDYTNNQIVGYQVDGTPITVEEFRKQAEISIKEVENGKYYTTDQLREMYKKW